MDRFTNLLHELGQIFSLPLDTDRHRACSIQIGPITVQLQLDSTQEFLFLFAKIAPLPPGKFRENVLAAALKANALPDPRIGHFGYRAATNHLCLHQKYPFSILTAERLASFFALFYEMALSWNQAILSGQIAPTGAISSTTPHPPPFGLRP